MSSFSFSKIAIIQSLDSGECETGTKLGKYIDDLRAEQTTVPRVELTNVNGRDEFLRAIDNLTTDAEQNDECPILQIEMHGWDDKSGLAFPDDSSLTWAELSAPLARLNRATGFNLLVCMSACFGGHALSFIKPDSPSPCFALIGPTDSVSPRELLVSFCALYRELLINLNANTALSELRAHGLAQGGFVTVTADDWFFKLAAGYLRTHCTKTALQARTAAIIKRMEEEGKMLSSSDAKNIALIGELMATRFLDRQFPKFFMLDDIPTNRDRFEQSLTTAAHQVAEFMRSQN